MLRFFFGTLVVVAGVCSLAASASEFNINQHAIKAHLEFLADDLLNGRGAGTEQYDIAANYVESHFKQHGIEVFRQSVPMISIEMDYSTPKIAVGASGKKLIKINYPEQMVIWPNPRHKNMKHQAEMVFVGYGIIAPEFNIDDYQGMDVKGKIVVVLRGWHPEIPSEEAAHLQAMKSRFAADHGASGIIHIHPPEFENIVPWSRYATQYFKDEFVYWSDNGIPFDSKPELKVIASIHHESARQLFANSKVDYDDVLAANTNKKALPKFAMGSVMKASYKAKLGGLKSDNVIGLIRGSDPVLSKEYVLYTAHLDHVHHAIDKDKKDNIYNGALDNASGTAIMLETARQIANMKVKPKRSILFIALAAEEKGLLGSSYYANKPLFPIEDTVANVNLDMPVILYPFKDVIAFGESHSSLSDNVRKAAAKLGIEVTPDPVPEQTFFVRSDHYNFVKQGVPAVFMQTGYTSLDSQIDAKKRNDDFIKNHYHQPSDAPDLAIDYQAAARIAHMNLLLGLDIANQQERPTWNKGDFFGGRFAK